MKRVPPYDSSLSTLARAGQESCGEPLNFDVSYTTSNGYYLIIGGKVCHIRMRLLALDVD